VETVEIAKALILGKFGKELAEGLYSGVSLNEIKTFLARDLRIVSHGAQQRFVAVIGPGMGIDATSNNVFGTLTPTIDDVLNYTFKSGYALQVGFNYGTVGDDWRKAKVYSSELYALEKLVVEVEGKDASELGEARRATKVVIDHLLSYVKDVYVEFSGHKSFYVAVWLPNPVVGVRAEGLNITLREFYRTMGISLLGRVARRVRGLVDMQFINAVKLLRVPGYLHEETGKPAQYLDADLKPAEFDPSIMDVAVVSPRFITSIVNRIILHKVEWQPRRRPRKHVKLGKVEEWNIVVKYMLNEGVRVNDGRIRFSYVLGNWCAAKRLGLDKCREIHSRLVENANTREYQRYLEYGYQHPEYLPWPFVFFKGSEWYSVPDVEVFRDVFEALRGRIRRHVEVKHAPRPEAGQSKPSEVKPTPKPEVEPKQSEVEVKTEASPKPKPEVKVEASEPKTEANAQSSGVESKPTQKPEVTEAGAGIEAKPTEGTEGPVVDVKGIVDRVKSWLIILFKYNSEVVNKLEPIIEQIVSFIVERGVVGKWELWDKFYNEVKKLNTDDADSLFSDTLDIIIMAMEGMGLLKVNKNILTVVGKTSEAKPSEANAAKTEGKSSGVNETKPEAKVEVKTKPEQELEPPVGSEVKVEGNVSEANAPKTEVEGSSSGANQRGQADTPVPEPEPNQELHGAHASGGMNHDSPTQPEAKATINIGDFINYSEAPVEAIVIRQSIIHSEAVEAPVNIATVDRIARRLCNSEDCIVSARLAITFIIGAVGKGPVRVGWLEDAFKSRHPIHYKVLRSEGINMRVILMQLKGLGIVVVGDIVTPGGWHSKWVTGLIPRLLEARGRVSFSELVKMVRESEPDLPDAFEGGLTLGDHVAMAVKYLEWRGAVKVEGEAVTLVK